MKPLVGTLGGLWAAGNLVVAFLFVMNAFVAKTAAKEGLPAQAALLLGGLLIGAFAFLVAKESLALIRTRGASEG